MAPKKIRGKRGEKKTLQLSTIGVDGPLIVYCGVANTYTAKLGKSVTPSEVSKIKWKIIDINGKKEGEIRRLLRAAPEHPNRGMSFPWTPGYNDSGKTFLIAAYFHTPSTKVSKRSKARLKVDLEEIQFNNAYPIWKDSPGHSGWGVGSDQYPTKWSKINLAITSFPICIKKNNKLDVKIKLKTNVAPTQDVKVKLKLKGPGRLDFETDVTFKSGHTETDPFPLPVSTDGKLANKVYIYSKKTFSWQISFDKGSTYQDLLKTKHKIYVIFDKPKVPTAAPHSYCVLTNSDKLTEKRLEWILKKVKRSSSIGVIASGIQLAVNGEKSGTVPYFDGRTSCEGNIIVSVTSTGDLTLGSDLTDIWYLLETKSAGSCMAHANLIRYAANLLGIAAEIDWIWPRTRVSNGFPAVNEGDTKHEQTTTVTFDPSEIAVSYDRINSTGTLVTVTKDITPNNSGKISGIIPMQPKVMPGDNQLEAFAKIGPVYYAGGILGLPQLKSTNRLDFMKKYAKWRGRFAVWYSEVEDKYYDKNFTEYGPANADKELKKKIRNNNLDLSIP